MCIFHRGIDGNWLELWHCIGWIVAVGLGFLGLFTSVSNSLVAVGDAVLVILLWFNLVWRHIHCNLHLEVLGL